MPCNHRTLGRRPGCELDEYSEWEAVQSIIGNFAGTVYFVDPNHAAASDANAGTSPAKPLATVAQALTQVSAYTGDAIVVMNNGGWQYASGVTGRDTAISEAVTITTPGITIVGVCPSPLGVPWNPPEDNAHCITVHAIDVTIQGFNFWSSTTTGETGIIAEWDSPNYFGESLIVRNCFFEGMAYGIELDYTWYCLIENCRFEALGTAAIHNPSTYGEPDYLVVRDCILADNTADINLPDCDYCLIEGNRFMDVTAAIVITNGDHNHIMDNVIEGSGAGANNMINLTSGGDNVVGGNYLTCTIVQYDTTCSDATSGSWGGNHCEDGATTAAPT